MQRKIQENNEIKKNYEKKNTKATWLNNFCQNAKKYLKKIKKNWVLQKFMQNIL